jgi:(4-(4-[2-(gamma-L-glutamylamino)ethyl]phenoxymethyl)furan-2-yl)methanamine synthase
MPDPESTVIGWDIGGAHLKACRLEGGAVADIALWACPLWQGLDRLDRAFDLAAARWPDLRSVRHAVTMTGEMADLFADREQGVRRIAERTAGALGGAVRFFAGDAGWCGLEGVGPAWAGIASANWLASARLAARGVGDGVLVDVGSTTTDVIALRHGGVATASRSDAARLASSELVYHGVVRTPLCAVARRIGFRGATINVMNEFFATAADVYRLTGELDAAHDLYPSADSAAKDAAATRQRLARMIGLDACDAAAEDWLAFAHAWRAEQLALIGEAVGQVAAAQGVADDAPLVAAGCGSFLVAALAAASGRPLRAYLQGEAGDRAGIARLARPGVEAVRCAQVCAPSVAVAALYHEEHQACG